MVLLNLSTHHVPFQSAGDKFSFSEVSATSLSAAKSSPAKSASLTAGLVLQMQIHIGSRIFGQETKQQRPCSDRISTLQVLVFPLNLGSLFRVHSLLAHGDPTFLRI